jgi:multiple sugar transport system substrate-binding protein
METGLKANGLTGLTWGHRRAVAPLEAASNAYAAQGGTAVNWQVRDLRRFEHEPLHVVARTVDLIVFDHPFCGVIAQSGCLSPLPANWIMQTLGSDPAARFVGRSYESYVYAGQLWGLPVDAACNHAAYRSDLLVKHGDVPLSWEAVLELGRRARGDGRWLAMGAQGHHGLLAVAALMANAGKPFPEGDRSGFTLNAAVLLKALDKFRGLLDCCVPESLSWNSIDVQDAMVARDDLVYCPVVYGFATYGEVGGRRRLSFSPLPGDIVPCANGAVIGGAAVGVSANCSSLDEALDYLAFLAQAQTQVGSFGANSGQAARVEVWSDPALDGRYNGYFSGALSSMTRCSMRPRFVGYQQFERRAGDILEQGIRSGTSSEDIVNSIVQEADQVRQGSLSNPTWD